MQLKSHATYQELMVLGEVPETGDKFTTLWGEINPNLFDLFFNQPPPNQ